MNRRCFRVVLLIAPEGIPGLRTPIRLSRSPLGTDIAAPTLGNGSWAFSRTRDMDDQVEWMSDE